MKDTSVISKYEKTGPDLEFDLKEFHDRLNTLGDIVEELRKDILLISRRMYMIEQKVLPQDDFK